MQHLVGDSSRLYIRQPVVILIDMPIPTSFHVFTSLFYAIIIIDSCLLFTFAPRFPIPRHCFDPGPHLSLIYSTFSPRYKKALNLAFHSFHLSRHPQCTSRSPRRCHLPWCEVAPKPPTTTMASAAVEITINAPKTPIPQLTNNAALTSLVRLLHFSAATEISIMHPKRLH